MVIAILVVDFMALNLLWRPSDAYMCQYNILTLVQIMACHLFSAKPLSDPMLPYCQLNPEEHLSVKTYLKFTSFHSRKCTWKCRLPKWRPFCLCFNVLMLLGHQLAQCRPQVYIYFLHIDGLVQERCNSSALAMELRLSCINSSIYVLQWFGLISCWSGELVWNG